MPTKHRRAHPCSAHAHRDGVIRGAEEDRESAKGRKQETEAKSIRLRVAARDTFAACQPSLSPSFVFFRPFAASRSSSTSRDVQVKRIPAADFNDRRESFPQNKAWTFHHASLTPWKAHPCSCPSRQRDPRRGRGSRKGNGNRRRRVSGSAWPRDTFAACCLSPPFFRASPFALRVFAILFQASAMFTLREYQRRISTTAGNRYAKQSVDAHHANLTYRKLTHVQQVSMPIATA